MLDLYKNIKKLRLENGWSQSELARRAGYKDRSAIAHVEDGTVDLPQSKIMLFADIFGVTPAQLFGNSAVSELIDVRSLTPDEADLLTAYRGATEELKDAAFRVLGSERQERSSRSRNAG